MGYLLALESSCDESAAAVIEMETGRPAASVVYSQIDLHRRYGGANAGGRRGGHAAGRHRLGLD